MTKPMPSQEHALKEASYPRKYSLKYSKPHLSSSKNGQSFQYHQSRAMIGGRRSSPSSAITIQMKTKHG